MKRWLVAYAVLLLLTLPASAEVFVLSNGGHVVGQLVNRDQSPRKQYIIQIADGLTVVLDKSQVQKFRTPRPDEAEYERIYPTYPDTVAGQWELAQWCRNHHLTPQGEQHLRRVVELDPDHAEARRILGYKRVEGKWVTQAEVMAARGLVYYKGQWRTSQEVELLKEKDAAKATQKDWYKKVRMWRGWLGGRFDKDARDHLSAITDPAAVSAMRAVLRDDADPAVRLLFVGWLAKIDTPDAAEALAEAAVYDPVKEVRLACLDYLEAKKRPSVVTCFISKLKDKKNNEAVNNAAVGLGQMKDASAIRPLIDALIWVHTVKVSEGAGIGANFGSGGGGLSVGQKPKYVRLHDPNKEVLNALIVLTGKNFGYDQQEWRKWYALQKRTPNASDARRDE
jgi:hypothetical protein